MTIRENRPTVTVLLTVFNAGEYLLDAIDSVLEQTFADWEMVIMDDGSTDPRVESTLALADDPRVTVKRFHPSTEEREEAVRYAWLINWGAERTTGRYITYLCGDDYYMPDRFERMVALLDAGNDVVYGSQVCLNEDGTQTIRGTENTLDCASSVVDHNSVMHTRESFEKVGGWPTNPRFWRAADAFFWERLTSAGYLFIPVKGEPTDAKRFRSDSIATRIGNGMTPWT